MGTEMKVLHICLSCFYIDGSGYQENFLVRQHVQDGHEVLVIASTEIFDGAGGLSYSEPGRYEGGDGAPVIRLPYTRWLPHRIARKLRFHPDLYRHIAEFKPDTILFHGCAGAELVTVASYVSDHPEVAFYVDSHEDFNNSARSFVSRKLLHGIFYRNRLQRALPRIRKILCISTESIDFVNQVYGVARDRLEFYPLGGFVLSNENMETRRAIARRALGVRDGEFVVLQSGKMTPRKKLSDSLKAFSSSQDPTLRFFIVGMIVDDIKDEIHALIVADDRVSFLGWKSTEELTDLLCAADVYLQPGTQSATMQHALCCGCPVIIDDVPAHEPYASSGAIMLNERVSISDALGIVQQRAREDSRHQATQFAQRMLDYGILSNRIFH